LGVQGGSGSPGSRVIAPEFTPLYPPFVRGEEFTGEEFTKPWSSNAPPYDELKPLPP
jgi:hypothetical protein